MRAKWLLAAAGSIMTVSAGFLWYVYPSETASIIHTVLGVSNYTAAMIFFGLMVFGGGGCFVAFLLVNLRDYYRTHPSETKAKLNLSARVTAVGGGFTIAVGYTLVLLVMALYSSGTPTANAFIGTLTFSIACCINFVVYVLKNPKTESQVYWMLILFIILPYFFIYGVYLVPILSRLL